MNPHEENVHDNSMPVTHPASMSWDSSWDTLLQVFSIVGRLKHLVRTGWVKKGVQHPEDVSGHMYRMAMIAAITAKMEGLDVTRCVLMSLVHDLAESIVGDFTPHCGVSDAEKNRREVEAMTMLSDALVQVTKDENSDVTVPSFGTLLLELFTEYEEASTPTALFVKDIDKFDMVLQAYEYEYGRYAMCGHPSNSTTSINFLDDFFQSTKGRFKTSTFQSLMTALDRRRAEMVPPVATLLPLSMMCLPLEASPFYHSYRMPQLLLSMKESSIEILTAAILSGYTGFVCTIGLEALGNGQCEQQRLLTNLVLSMESRLLREKLFLCIILSVSSSVCLSDQVSRCLEQSQCDYIDMVLLDGKNATLSLWMEMEQWLGHVKVRAIGIHHPSLSFLASIVEGNYTKPAAVVLDLNPLSQQPSMKAICQEHAIICISSAPMPSLSIEKQATLALLGGAYNVPLSHILLRWNLQQGNVCMVNANESSALVNVGRCCLSRRDIKLIDQI